LRYLRLKKEDVIFVSGTDEHGVPITIKAQKEGKTPQEVVDFIDVNRTNRQGRVPTMKRNMKGITSRPSFNEAIRIKARKAGTAKGGWVGAGKAIGAKQRKGSKITISKDVAGYAHKFQTGGTATLQRDTWNPIGKIINNVSYVSTDYVLKASDASNAINTGGRMTIKWTRRSWLGCAFVRATSLLWPMTMLRRKSLRRTNTSIIDSPVYTDRIGQYP
jgi:hypothetical protein